MNREKRSDPSVRASVSDSESVAVSRDIARGPFYRTLRQYALLQINFRVRNVLMTVLKAAQAVLKARQNFLISMRSLQLGTRRFY